MNKLTNLEAVEVSLVPRGANLKKFLIFKSEEGFRTMEEILKSILEIELENENDVDEVLKAAKMSEKATGAAKAALKILSAYKDELPSDIINMLASLSGYGYAAPQKSKDKYGYKMDKEKDKGYKMPCKKEDGSLDLEAVPEEVRPLVESLWKEHETAIAKAAELEETLRLEKEEKSKKEFISKALEFDSLNVKAEELGLVLKSISEKAPEGFEKIMTILKSANEAIKQGGLFKEVGTNGTNSENTAWGKIESMAKTMVQKDVNMTQAQAIAKVLNQNPELYNEYLKEGGN